MDPELQTSNPNKAMAAIKSFYPWLIILALSIAWLFYDVAELKKTLVDFSDDVVSDFNDISSELSYVRSIAANADLYAHSHNTYSDQRLKVGVEPLAYSLDEISQLRPVTFYWDKENPLVSDQPSGRQLGMIAHEVENVIPELVYTDNSGYKHMDYVSLTPILVEVIKEQQSQLDSMQMQIEELSNQLEQLEISNEK